MSSLSIGEPSIFLRHRVAALLDLHGPRLIEEWAAMLRQSLPDEITWRLTDQELVTGVEPLLDAITVQIRGGSGPLSSPSPLMDAMQTARALGTLRREQGSSLRDIVHENILFQQRLWSLLKHTMRRSDADLLEVIRRINDGISSVLLESIASYHEQDTAELRDLAVTDVLLGIYNRHHFDIRLQEELKRAQRAKQSFALLLIDTDRFKNINDTYGHREGDQVLRRIASLLRETVRDPDITARFGGDEFAIILPNTERRGAWTLALRLSQRITTDLALDPNVPATTISTGIAIFPRDGTTEAELIDAADAAMYRSKALGRGAITCYHPSLSR